MDTDVQTAIWMRVNRCVLRVSIFVLCCPQIAKLLIIPFVCLVERFWLGKTFSRSVIASVVTVVCGVAIV